MDIVLMEGHLPPTGFGHAPAYNFGNENARAGSDGRELALVAVATASMLCETRVVGDRSTSNMLWETLFSMLSNSCGIHRSKGHR